MADKREADAGIANCHRGFKMKNIIKAVSLLAVFTALCTGCSRSIDMDKLRGGWVCTPENGEAIAVTITDEYFTQSSGNVTGEPLKYERTSDGIVVRNTDGKALITLNYNGDNDTVSYTVKNSDGSDLTLTFSREQSSEG